MNPNDAEKLLERVFPFEQCDPRAANEPLWLSNGPHNYRAIPVFNAYTYAGGLG